MLVGEGLSEDCFLCDMCAEDPGLDHYPSPNKPTPSHMHHSLFSAGWELVVGSCPLWRPHLISWTLPWGSDRGLQPQVESCSQAALWRMLGTSSPFGDFVFHSLELFDFAVFSDSPSFWLHILFAVGCGNRFIR